MCIRDRLYPVPDVEEFTIGRRAEQTGKLALEGPGEPWDEPALRKLTEANPATLAMLDLCAAEGAQTVLVKDVAAAAGITEGAVRGQLAGFTMRIRNPKNGFTQTHWPVNIRSLPNGIIGYDMDDEIAAIWRELRPEATSAIA